MTKHEEKVEVKHHKKSEAEEMADYREKLEKERIAERTKNEEFVHTSKNVAVKESPAHDKNATVAGIGEGKLPKGVKHEEEKKSKHKE